MERPATFASALLLLTLFAIHATCEDCRSGWFYHEGSCYGVGTESVTWAEAQEYCILYQSTLVEINSKAENDYLTLLSKTHATNPNEVWIGGTDIFNEGHWEWIGSKEPLDGYSNWKPGEPNHSHGASGEDCIQLYAGMGGVWNDQTCTDTMNFICEAEPDSTVFG